MSENLLHFQTFDRSMRRSASQRTSISHRLKRTVGVQICKSSFFVTTTRWAGRCLICRIQIKGFKNLITLAYNCKSYMGLWPRSVTHSSFTCFGIVSVHAIYFIFSIWLLLCKCASFTFSNVCLFFSFTWLS